VLPAHNLPGGRRIRYPLPDPAPHVSIIIPTRNQAHLLRQALVGVLGETRYPALDVIIADNGSDGTETLALFEELGDDARVSILPLPGPFNFSRLNNEAVKKARGEVLAFLNNDVSIIDPGWLTEMVSRAVQPGVGAVGAKLYYPSGRIQHAGVVLGSGGVARHWFAHAPRDLPGPMGELLLARDVSAVTAACMVVRRIVFDEVGGFDAEHLAVDFNDVDLCLRLRERGYRVVWTPFAEVMHHESASRRTDAEASNRPSRKIEADYMRSRWRDVLGRDPFFSPNLSPDGTFAMPPRVKRPWDG
jgi:GT2 family glycosyltransferase